MIAIEAIDHIVLRTDRYQALITFYCEVLGCKIERKADKSLGLTQLRAGSALIDIIDIHGQLGKAGGPAATTQGNNVDHFCLQIAAVDETALLQFLQQYKVPCSQFEDRYGARGMGRSLYIKDLAGNTVELRPLTSPNKT